MNPERRALLFDWRRAALISSAHPRTSNDVLKRSKPLVAPFATPEPIDVRYFFTVLSEFFLELSTTMNFANPMFSQQEQFD